MASPAPPGSYGNRSGVLNRFLQRPVGDLSSLATTPVNRSINNNSSENNNDKNNHSNNSNDQHIGVGVNNREVEQRFARIVAEYEYKLLEERGRAQEKESRMNEELLRLRQQVQQQPPKVLTTLTQRPSAVGDDGGGVVSKEEFERLQSQLAETRELLQESERRYQQEKRELLNLRTAQLRNETSKRGQEGDIIARAMQVMSEYESVVRGSEENSLSRLAHHMDTFEKEWIRRAREFEEQKSVFEATMMEKTRQALAQHQQDMDSASRAMLEKTTQMLRGQSDTRLEVEEQVMRHAELFKEEYKQILEKEFYDRCRLYDEKLAERERGWVKVLQEERRRIVAAEQQAVKEHEALHVEALEDAMRDLSRLREQLVREHQAQQAAAMKDLIARREALQRDHDAHIAAVDAHLQSVQSEAAGAIAQARDEAAAAVAAAAAREAAATRREFDAANDSGAAAMSRAAALRAAVEAQWAAALEEARQEHSAALAKAAEEHSQREGALLARCERRVAEADEKAEARWGARAMEAQQSAQRYAEALEALRGENAALLARAAALEEETARRAMEAQQKAQRERRSADEAWHARVEAMRQRYDALLDEALGGAESRCVSRADYDTAVAAISEWEEKCAKLSADAERRVAAERECVNAAWAQRLEAQAKEHTAHDEAREKHFAELRAVLVEDAARHAEVEATARRKVRSAADAEIAEAQQLCAQRVQDAVLAAERDAAQRVMEAHQKALECVAQQKAALEQREARLREERMALAEAARQCAAERIAEDEALFHARMEAREAAFANECAAREKETARLMEQRCDAMARSAAALVAAHQKETTDVWLAARAEELSAFAEERVEFTRLCAVQRSADAAEAVRLAQCALDAERDGLEARDKALQSHAEVLAQQSAARQSALVQALRDALAEAHTQHAVTDAEQYAAQQIACARAAHDAEAHMRQSHEALAAQFAAQLEAERQRHRDDADAAERRHLLQLEEQRAAQLEKESAMRSDAEARHWAQTRALEDAWAARLRDAESEAAAERERCEEAAEAKARAADRAAELREDALRQKVEEAAREHSAAMAQFAEAQARRSAEVQAAAEAARSECAARCVAEMTAAREAMDAEFAQFVSAAAKRDEQRAAELREAMAQCAAAHAAAANAAAEGRAAVEAERRRSEKELEERTALEEERRLHALREVEQRYAQLFAETQCAARKAREEWARRALGEEERRLAQRIAEAAEAPPRQQQQLPQQPQQLQSQLQQQPQQMSPWEPLQGTSQSRAVHQPQQWQSQDSPLTSPERFYAEPQPDEKISQLWAVLEVPEAERRATLKRWAQLPEAQRAEETRRETRCLELQLPLLEVVTRREFVLHRLRELEKSAAGGAAHSAQVEDLRREGRKLAEHLRAEIPRHEAVHGCTFRFRGERYMETLLDESF